MTVNIDTLEQGLFEINIFANVSSPTYEDSAKILVNVVEVESVYEKLVFTEEFIVSNPECAELRDLLDEAQKLRDSGDFEGANSKAQEAIDACRKAIAQPIGKRIKTKLGDNIFGYISLASVAALAFGCAYYYYRRIKFKKQIQEYIENI